MTGGGRSTGTVVKERFEDEGYNVKSIGRSEGNLVRKDLSTIRDEGDATSLMHLCYAGDTDALINLSGLTLMKTWDQWSAGDWQQVIHLNTTVPWLLSQAYLRRKHPTPANIINVASIAYRQPLSYSLAYNVSKAGLVAMTKQLAKDLGNRAKIIAVAPSQIEGSDMMNYAMQRMLMLRNMGEKDAIDYINAGTPMGRMQTMSEVAEMVYMAFLAPDFMTGSVIEATGGLS